MAGLSWKKVRPAYYPFQRTDQNRRNTRPFEGYRNVDWPVGFYIKVGAIRDSHIVIGVEIVVSGLNAMEKCEAVLIGICDSPIGAASDLHSKAFDRAAPSSIFTRKFGPT